MWLENKIALSALECAISSDDIAVTTLKVKRGRFINNNYMVLNRRISQALLIDPAWEIDTLETALKDVNAELAGILITHAHPDHIDLAEYLANKHRCPVWISRKEAASSGFCIPSMRTFEECSWDVAGMLIRPIITPGHTSGSTCYWIGQHVFTGDTLFIEGCGLCSNYADAASLFASIERLKTMLPGKVRIYPGHSYVHPPGLTFEQVFRYNIYLLFDNAEDFIKFRMRQGQNKTGWMAFS
ncbi:solanimycin biosynthesis MBL-fold hydrolase SolJ [Dickeya solani]|uniref:Solanimycin biosynthesis MBL-fold hydrolase SolJ n=1 Tax=Dickeya solani TaxID=1089444 RepID=A0ABU4EJF5_9GAMM|nr:solanimycin biosynthesis MBL-fold hydrolase SolJ [Dickeya solani]MCA6999537.1 MBL fold metallo-hydrolase [Dickeya solani]MCZ0823789.1 MBL fold metallo-hydrolase [Dickeya solani]MDV6993749.1 solanimycin biosynthesis MBL-fold hydrolase SolJ [Dickeya solani]MDV7005105.1 solanimycin biosynthesis MBL-fold hydrolase SolJ [Dickeya solani]MDV7038922.1 solanimycin biosynthesis MBL-fold hydrolase SolJ [Dickeya solani]